jgi:hypothetical protein
MTLEACAKKIAEMEYGRVGLCATMGIQWTVMDVIQDAKLRNAGFARSSR